MSASMPGCRSARRLGGRFTSSGSGAGPTSDASERPPIAAPANAQCPRDVRCPAAGLHCRGRVASRHAALPALVPAAAAIAVVPHPAVKPAEQHTTTPPARGSAALLRCRGSHPPASGTVLDPATFRESALLSPPGPPCRRREQLPLLLPGDGLGTPPDQIGIEDHSHARQLVCGTAPAGDDGTLQVRWLPGELELDGTGQMVVPAQLEGCEQVTAAHESFVDARHVSRKAAIAPTVGLFTDPT